MSAADQAPHERPSADAAARCAAVLASSGAYTEAFGPGHLEELREDWPA